MSENQEKSSSSMIGIIILFVLFFFIMLIMLVSCSQTRNLTNEVDSYNTDPISTNLVTFSNLTVTGTLESDPISNVESSINSLITSINALNTSVPTAFTNFIPSDTTPVILGTLTVASTTDMSNINISGNATTINNITCDNITTSDSITTGGLIINNAIGITPTEITPTTFLETSSYVQFSSAGTSFTCLQSGSVGANPYNQGNAILSVNFGSVFPNNIIPQIFATLDFGHDEYVVTFITVTSSGFSYRTINTANNDTNNGVTGFYYLAIG